MSTHAKPCIHCGNTTFQFLPGMTLPVSHLGTVLGMNVVESVAGRHWKFSLLICDNCGCTLTFTSSIEELVKYVPGATTTVAK